MNENPKSIIVKETFNTTSSNVWDAITELEQMKKWYFDNIPEFLPKVGFTTQFNIKSGERDFFHIWKITEVIPQSKITYNWKFKGYKGSSDVSFNLTELEDQTLLTLDATGIETFPKDVPEFTYESGKNGWNYFIKNRLKEYIDNKYN